MSCLKGRALRSPRSLEPRLSPGWPGPLCIADYLRWQTHKSSPVCCCSFCSWHPLPCAFQWASLCPAPHYTGGSPPEMEKQVIKRAGAGEYTSEVIPDWLRIKYLHTLLKRKALPVAPVKRVEISSDLLVRMVSQLAQEKRRVPPMWSKKMRPIVRMTELRLQSK